MKTTLLTLASLAAFALVGGAHAAGSFQNGQAAIGVIGQPDFKTKDAYLGQVNRFSMPLGVACDSASGKVFVSDSFNHRVLRFASIAAAEAHLDPDMVFGQPDYTSHWTNQDNTASPVASGLYSPGAITVDAKGRLWVADTRNHRVVGYFAATTAAMPGPAASIVLGGGQGIGKDKMNFPQAVSLGPDDTLWVADTGNNRVLAFANISAKTTGAAPDGVLGQPSFTANPPALGDGGMNNPHGLWADAAGRLWVADKYNHRVLRFDGAAAKAKTAITTGTSAKASGLLGQSTFGAAGTDTDETHVNECRGVYLDAAGTLWVCDAGYSRVLGFPAAAALAPGAPAATVLGQPNFEGTSSILETGKIVTPEQVSGGPGESLLIVDSGCNRVLRFSPIETIVPAPAAPVVKIAGPKKLTTAKAKLTIKGRATGPVTGVRCRIGGKPARKAKGTASWKLTVALKPGKNKITVIAHGPGGDSAPARLTLTRTARAAAHPNLRGNTSAELGNK